MTYRKPESQHLSTGVPQTTKTRYVLVMRLLGLALITGAFAGVLAVNAQPVAKQIAPDAPVAPHWTAATAEQFPGCVGTGSFIPARIVVANRAGETQAMPYSEATIAKIDATWATGDAWDDLYTIGRCAR